MIRRAQNSDRKAVAAIWKACFGDSDEYIRFFLDGLYDPAGCFLYVADGVPAAMLHLYPMNYEDEKSSLRIQYLYAAATLPEYRRRGIMSELVRYAVNFGAVNGFAFTALLPAGESLYRYYETCGFHSAFSLRRSEISRKDFEDFASGYGFTGLITPRPQMLFRLRKDCFNPGVFWEEKQFAYVLKEWQFTGGEILALEDAYCLLKRQEGKLFIKEYCAGAEAAPRLAAAIIGAYGEERFVLHLQPAQNYFPGKTIRYGMKSTGCEVKPQAYFNLLLD